MTLTSHGLHIPGTTTEDEDPRSPPYPCGGFGICGSCTYDASWIREFNAKRAVLFPSEVEGLDSQILRKISAKLREQTPKPRAILSTKNQLAASIYALADAVESVATDMETP